MNECRDKSLRKIGIWVLLYGIIVVGINLYLGIFLAYSVTYSNLLLDVDKNIFFTILTVTLLFGFLLSVLGGIILISNKIWGKKISVLGIVKQ